MFEDPHSARYQISKDKHTLLEGYITEYLYEKQFLIQKPRQYTSGWWSAKAGGKRFFFVVSEKLNDVDRAVMKALPQSLPCWHTFPEKETWYFTNGNIRLTEKQFLERYHLQRKERNAIASDITRDSERQNRCIDFFESHGILQKISIERYFANNFLSVYFSGPVNIDYIVQRNNGMLSAIEVKFKFETKNGYFGINCGQYNLFKLLEQSKIQIQHWILYNWTHDDTLSISGFLNEDMEKYWLSAYIDTSIPRKKRTAPSKTSVFGSNIQEYYAIDKNDFEFAAHLYV